MKIEKLSLNKIKVTVSPRDLMGWDISFESLSPDSPRLREFIMSLIRQAEFETGFDAFGANIMIEAMPQNNDFVFFITKVDSESVSRSAKQLLRAKLLNKEYRVVKKAVSSQKSVPGIFRFGSFEDFIAYLNAVRGGQDFSDGELYASDGAYYLKLPMLTQAQKRMAAVAGEFAVKNDTKFLEAYLLEHGKLVAKNDGFAEILKHFGQSE